MLDIGSWEFLIVIVIALIVIGPKDLPALVRNVSMWIRRARDMAREFQSGLEDMARETELDKVTQEFKADLDPDGLLDTVRQDVENSIDPDGSIRGVYDPYDMDIADDLGAGDSATADPDVLEDSRIEEPAESVAVGEDGAEPAKPGA